MMDKDERLRRINIMRKNTGLFRGPGAKKSFFSVYANLDEEALTELSAGGEIISDEEYDLPFDEDLNQRN